jgi:hypothetical protein
MTKRLGLSKRLALIVVGMQNGFCVRTDRAYVNHIRLY